MKIDLHSHTTYSDGTLEPEDLVQAAQNTGITHLAISDHDSTGSLEAARAKAAGFGMTIIPAVEINTRDAVSIHILGYFVEEKDRDFEQRLARHREIRLERAQAILDRLHRMGIRISLSDFNHRQHGAAIGRPHIADKLKEKGIVFSRQEAFDKFLAQGRPAYVVYEGPTPQDAIEIILAARGVPVIAHPGYSVSGSLLESLVKMGLAGIEAHYPSHNPDQVRNFLELAAKHGLVVTGGSDYHGPGSGHEKLGEIFAPEKAVDDLLERRRKLFG